MANRFLSDEWTPDEDSIERLLDNMDARDFFYDDDEADQELDELEEIREWRIAQGF